MTTQSTTGPLRTFSGKYCLSVDEKPEGVVWSIALADASSEEQPIVEGVAADSEQAVRAVYAALESVIRSSTSDRRVEV
jgi:hypothetical protein